MKIESNSFKTLVLYLAIFMSSVVNAQVNVENGIHVSGGSSSEIKISSNIGNSTIATGYNSFASGYASEASGHTSTALGREAKALGAYSGAFGNFVNASANNSFVLGTGFSSTFPLTNSTAGIMMGVNSQQPTLTITAAASAGRTGKIAIGNVPLPNVTAKLHIRSDNGENAGIILEPSNGKQDSAFIRLQDSYHYISVGTDDKMRINAGNHNLHLLANRYCLNTETTFLSNLGDSIFLIQSPEDTRLHSEFITLTGKVGINTKNTTASYALAVDGGIITTKVYIQDVEDWPDHVFEDTYRLMPLNELRLFIAKNKHLPDIPSESKVLAQGYDMDEMQRAMLKKIEELTLYTLQQQEEIETLRKIVEELYGK